MFKISDHWVNTIKPDSDENHEIGIANIGWWTRTTAKFNVLFVDHQSRVCVTIDIYLPYFCDVNQTCHRQTILLLLKIVHAICCVSSFSSSFKFMLLKLPELSNWKWDLFELLARFRPRHQHLSGLHISLCRVFTKSEFLYSLYFSSKRHIGNR